MDAEQIKSLIERTEKSEGADREIDALIYHDLLGFCRHARKVRTGAQSDTGFDCLDCGADSWGNKSRNGGYPAGQGLHDSAPRYTASIDAAMTLAPEGWRVQISDWDAKILRACGPWQCIFIAPGGRDNLSQWWPRCDHASSAPLAICSAALKAKIILDATSQ